MPNEITKHEQADLMWNAEGFAHAHSIGKMFAASELIPPHLRGKIADVTIAVLQAHRLREDPLILMQNMHVVSGKAGFNASYIIARLNKSGLLKGRVNFRTSGAGKELSVTAWAIDADTGEEVSETVTMAMADADGWTKNPKYRTMPERMLKYRAATGLMRLHYPEVMLGTSTVEELEDVAASSPAPRATSLTAALDRLSLAADGAAEVAAVLPDCVDAEEVAQPEPVAKPAPKPAAKPIHHDTDEDSP